MEVGGRNYQYVRATFTVAEVQLESGAKGNVEGERHVMSDVRMKPRRDWIPYTVNCVVKHY